VPDAQPLEKLFDLAGILRRERDVPVDVQVGEEGVFLKDVTDAPLLRRDEDARGRVDPGFVTEPYAALRRAVQACNETDQTRFSRA